VSRRKYSEEFRAEAVRRLKDCSNVSALARELGIRRKWLYEWREAARSPAKPARKVAVEDRQVTLLKDRIAELERLAGRLSAEVDFFKGALRRVEERRRKNVKTGGAASTSKLL
jgi:transposase